MSWPWVLTGSDHDISPNSQMILTMGTVTPYASIAIWNGITLGLQSYVIISNSSYDTAFQGGFLSDSRLVVFIGGWDSNTGDAVQTNNWFDVLVYPTTGLTSWIWNTRFSKTEYFSLSLDTDWDSTQIFNTYHSFASGTNLFIALDATNGAVQYMKAFPF